MPAALYYTAEMVRTMPDDGKRYETVHGELLMSPSPRMRHQVVLGRLYLAIGNFLAAERLAGLFTSPADISWSPDTLVQPDLFVADASEIRSGEWSDIRTLHLVAEILSPSTVHGDRYTKRRLYQENRVATYWLVDIDQAHVEVSTPDALFPRVEREQLTWRHPAATAELVVLLADLFADGEHP